jgi:hypothetical protein
VSINPYQSPLAPLDPPPRPGEQGDRGDAPLYALYSPRDVFIAAFFGSVAGGAVVMALNYRRVGRPELYYRTIVLGIGAQILAFGIAYLVPENVPGIVVSLAAALVTWGVARWLQAGPFALHMAIGGKKDSAWKAAGIGLLAGLAMTAAAFAVLVLLDNLFPDADLFAAAGWPRMLEGKIE